MTTSQLLQPGILLTVYDIAEVAAARSSIVSGLRDNHELRAAWTARRHSLLGKAGGIYGVYTGFGASCGTDVSADQSSALAANLFAYHGCGVGKLFTEQEGAAVLAVRIAQLASGHSALDPDTFDALVQMLEKRVIPCIPELGSVGASGDLTPLSYVAAVLSGERECYYRGAILPAEQALREAGLSPRKLGPKESLSLMNGTSVMTAIAALGVVRARSLICMHAAATAMAMVGLNAREDHFDARIFAAKPHPGSIAYAGWVRELLEGYSAGARGGVQDPYSLRCAPHVGGVLLDALGHAEAVLQCEINGASDNPLVCLETGDVLHGGNFYGGHVAYVCDTLKALVASSAELLERQLMLMTSPHRSRGLPENLVLGGGAPANAQHGFKAMEILASALIAEAMKSTMPAGSFSRSTEGHNQDKVSMGTIAARDLRAVLDLSETVLMVALLGCAQAIDARGGCAVLPPRLLPLYQNIRACVPALTEDRRQDCDIEALLADYRAGALARGLRPV